MKRIRTAMVSALTLGILGATTVASVEAHQTPGYGAKTRHVVKRNVFTPRERTIIAKQRHRLMRLRRQAFHDGYLNRWETRTIRRARRRLHHYLDWAKHNGYAWKAPRRYDRPSDHGHRHPRRR